DSLGFFDQFFYEGVSDVIEQIEALNRQTGLTAVEKTAHRGSAHRPVHIRVVADDHRIAAAQLQRDVLEVLGSGLQHPPPGIRSTRETDLTHGGVNEQLFTDHASWAGDDIEDTFWAASVLNRLIDQFTDAKIRKRGGAGWLNHDCVTGQQCWTKLVTHE